jgi:EmrB/QacA subfamily drug resistance transporter
MGRGFATPVETPPYVGMELTEPTSGPEQWGPGTKRRRWLVQGAVGFSILITTVDTGGINIALHTIAQHFAVDAGTIAWLPLLGFLAVTSTLLMFGRLSDILGNRVIFANGFIVYAGGALACGMAPTFPILLAARGLQAIGISMLSANQSAILSETFPPHQRGMALGISSTLVGLGYFLGPIIGGLIISAFGWRWIFFGTIPVCLLGFVLAGLVLPPGRKTTGQGFDFVGAAVFALAVTSLLLAINFARTGTFGFPLVLALVLVALASLASFVYVEKRVRTPMLQLDLLRVRLFTLALVAGFTTFFGLAGQELLVPLFSQQVLGLTAVTAGLAVSTVPFIRMLMSSPIGVLSDRVGPRWLTAAGAGISALGIFGLSRMDAGTSLPWLVGCMVVIGLGNGLFFSPNMHAIMSSVPQRSLGMASGALGMRRNLGQSFGVATAAYLLQTGTVGGNPVGGFQTAFTVQALFLVLAAVAGIVAGNPARLARRASSAPPVPEQNKPTE